MFEFDERDLIARHFTVEERLAEAAHERLLRTAIRTRQSRGGTRCPMGARSRGDFDGASHLLIHAGQRLETLASARSRFGASATSPPLPTSSPGQQE
ncbi:MAG: hypothetical protein LC793_08280 [Thermomicrobia bacterium]|nr:hypothetical protein [Thermomicrobia bacterium]